jgi:hypothetical protein
MNRGSESVLSVYSDARAEYTKQLCVFLVPAYFQFFIDLLEKSKQATVNEPKKSLWQFQTYLNEIHDWNMQKVNNEIHTINTNCGCDYLEDLLTAVFIAHTKVLTAIRLSSNKKKIEINVPKVEHFLFKVLCETSKLLWSSTYLFRDGIPGIEKQQNYRNIEAILNEGILQAVRSLVPVKSILKDFVNNDGDDTTAADSDSDDDDDDEKDNAVKEIVSEVKELSLLSATGGPQETSIPPPVSISEPDIPVSAPVVIPADIPVAPEPKNEIIIPSEVVQQQSPQTIVLDARPNVRFGDFDAVFDSDNPLESEMVYDPKDDEDDEVPALEILDDVGAPLSEGLDFDSLDEKADKSDDMGIGDYEELN